jgi:hypothetical protein
VEEGQEEDEKSCIMRVDVFGLECGNNVGGDFGINYQVPIAIDNVYNEHRQQFVDMVMDDKEKLDKDNWHSYNIFNIEHPYILELKNEIIKKYHEYVKTLSVTPKETLWINGWINPMKPGVSLGRHNHSLHENSYLTGVVVLKCKNSTTDLYLPLLEEIGDGIISIRNHTDQLMIFPQWVMHSVNAQIDYRLTIGFDLLPEESYNYMKEFSPDSPAIQHAVQLF